ncbi:hypothetical protein [Streptomyces roseifaciens]|nr:hypothetical protein [Streptomyces roseifaciens]
MVLTGIAGLLEELEHLAEEAEEDGNPQAAGEAGAYLGALTG